MPELTIISRDADVYAALLAERQLPNLTLATAASDVDSVQLDDIEILLSEPDLAQGFIQQCENLKWLQSTWAGNTPLIKLDKRDYQLTAVKGIFSAAMREFVFAYLLYFERNIAAFGHDQDNAQYHWPQPKTTSLAGKRLGVLGAGNIASGLVPVARSFDMHIVGANRSGQSEHEYDAVYSINDLENFTKALDYLVCILPDTPATENIVDANLLAMLPRHCVLINAGRGNAIDDNALIGALSTDKLKAAVLDVFRHEPLPQQHPFWSMDNVLITQHTAAVSDPKAVIDVFAENYLRWLANQPLKYQIEFERGY